MSDTRKARRRITFGLLIALTALFLMGIVVRLTVKDAIPYVAAVHYALPLPVLTFLAATIGVGNALLRKPRLTLLWLLVTFACIIWCWQQSYVRRGGTREDGDLQVVCWNPANGGLGWSKVLESLSERDPDIIGLIEAGKMSAQTRDEWMDRFHEYELTDHRRGMLLICRGDILNVEEGFLGNSGSYQLSEVRTSAGVVHVLLIDIHSDPFKFRREPLEAIVSLASSIGEKPLLIMGDFNMPVDSVHFDRLRTAFANAFETRGLGYAPTWPLPLPVLQLDHIWANNAVTVTECEAGWSWSSDHRPVVAWFHLGPRPVAEDAP